MIFIKGRNNVVGFLKANYRKYPTVLYTNHNCSPPLTIKNCSKAFLHVCANDLNDPTDPLAPTIEQVQKILGWSEFFPKFSVLLSCGRIS